MAAPNITFYDYLGSRIFSIETPEGFVHVCNKQVFEHVSDAVRYLRGDTNPVVEAMEEEITVQDGVSVEGDQTEESST